MDEASKLGEQSAPARRTYGAVAKAALGVAGVGAVAALRGSDVGASVSSALFGSPTAALDDAPGGGSELSFYVWSDYTDTYGDVGTSYTWYSDGGYAGIVEPYVPQTLVADCAACSPDTTYTWTFSGGETAFGNEVERMFYALETYDVQVSATAGDSVLASYAGTVVCRYVRREIRQLSSTDRNRFFDAMKVLWTQTSDIGQDIYGPSFLRSRRRPPRRPRSRRPRRRRTTRASRRPRSCARSRAASRPRTAASPRSGPRSARTSWRRRRRTRGRRSRP